ncbi:MAG TPA: hypothetical protein VMU10_11840 [Desulfomonilia bacterium]|nr:hypothetical protein [Desulfomonilia bacterium]
MKNLKIKDWTLLAGEAGLFLIVLITIWLDEFMDLPYLLLGAPPTPYRPQEYIIESVSILLVGLIVMCATLIILRRYRRLEKFLRVCAWCRKVWVNDKWVRFEEYVMSEHSLKSSHGICDECLAVQEKKRQADEKGKILIYKHYHAVDVIKHKSGE